MMWCDSGTIYRGRANGNGMDVGSIGLQWMAARIAVVCAWPPQATPSGFFKRTAEREVSLASLSSSRLP